MAQFIITESQFDAIKKYETEKENNSFEIFITELKKAIYHLMTDDKINISDYFRINGIKTSELKNKLLSSRMIIQDENGKIVVPKKNFTRKAERIYNDLFPEEPGLIISEDDGGAGGEGAFGGATTAASSGSYEAPVFGVQRRKF